MKTGHSKLRKNSYRLEIPAGTPSREMLRRFALDCLVPVLAASCLREWEAEQQRAKACVNDSTTVPLLIERKAAI